MRATAIFVQFVAAAFPVFHSFMENGDQVGLGGALDHHEVLHEEAVLNVPPAVQDPRGGIQQVPQLLVVDLEEAGLHVELLLPHRHLLPHVPH